MEAWWPKLDATGLLIGHDWAQEGVTDAVVDFIVRNDLELKHEYSIWKVHRG